jgi:hypothetical protein
MDTMRKSDALGSLSEDQGFKVPPIIDPEHIY